MMLHHYLAFAVALKYWIVGFFLLFFVRYLLF